MYWLTEMHKIPIGSRVTVVSKTCSTMQLSNIVSKVHKMVFNHVKDFHNKSHF